MIENTSTHSAAFLAVLRHLFLVWTVIWILLRLISNAEAAISRTAKDVTTITAVSKVLRLIVFVIGGLAVMQNLGLSLSGVLTFGGVGGLIVGMAAKDLLANFFGAVMIYFDRPFQLGDWIRSPDRNIEGTVEQIGFRVTMIRTFDKRPLYVPNSVFSSIVVENASRMTNRRIKQTVGLRYQDAEKVEGVVKDIKAMLTLHDDIDTTQTMIVSFDNYGPSSLNILVYTFTKTVGWVEYKEVQQDVMLKIVEIVKEHGADFASRRRHCNSIHRSRCGRHREVGGGRIIHWYSASGAVKISALAGCQTHRRGMQADATASLFCRFLLAMGQQDDSNRQR